MKAGDVLLLLGSEGRLSDVLDRMSLLPLKDRGQQLLQRDWAWGAVSIFIFFVAVASFGYLSLPIALGFVAALYVFFNWVPIGRVYEAIEWPIVGFSLALMSLIVEILRLNLQEF